MNFQDPPEQMKSSPEKLKFPMYYEKKKISINIFVANTAWVYLNETVQTFSTPAVWMI